MLAGLFSAKLDLTSKGLEAENIEKNLNSQFQSNLKNGQIYGFDPETLLFKAIASKIPGLKAPKPKSLKFDDLGLKMQVKNGKIKTTEPFKLNTPEGEFLFSLATDFDLKANLKGTWMIPPALIQKIIRKPMKSKEAIPVKIELEGHFDDLKVKHVDWEPILKAVIKELGGAAVEKAVDKAIDQLGGKEGKKVKNEVKNVLKKIF